MEDLVDCSADQKETSALAMREHLEDEQCPVVGGKRLRALQSFQSQRRGTNPALAVEEPFQLKECERGVGFTAWAKVVSDGKLYGLQLKIALRR